MKFLSLPLILSLFFGLMVNCFAFDAIRIQYKVKHLTSVQAILEKFLKDGLSKSQKAEVLAEAQLIYNGKRTRGLNYLIPTGSQIEFRIKKNVVDSQKVRLYYLSLLPVKNSSNQITLVQKAKSSKKTPSDENKKPSFSISYNYIQLSMKTFTESESTIKFNINRAALAYRRPYNDKISYSFDIAGLVNSTPEVTIGGVTQEVILQEYGVEAGTQINYTLDSELSFSSSFRRMRYILGREQTETYQSFIDTYIYKLDLGSSYMWNYPFGVFGNIATFLNTTVKGIKIQNSNSLSVGAFYLIKNYSLTALYSSTQVNTNYGSNDSAAWVLALGYKF